MSNGVEGFECDAKLKMLKLRGERVKENWQDPENMVMPRGQ